MKESNKVPHKGLPKAKLSKMDLSTKFSIIFVTSFVILILGVLISFILYQSIPALKHQGFFKFIFGGTWDPSNNVYGIGKIIASTMMMLLIALLFAIPLTIFSALFITEYLRNRTKKFVITMVQLLAGIPSVVFGLFALDQIGPIFVAMGAPSGDNMMTASLTLAFMALPTMIALSINAIEAVPDSQRFAALGLGMTKERTTFSVVLVYAMPKIVTAIITGIARIIGETMAVILIAGNSSQGLNTGNGFSGFIFSAISTLAGTIGLEMLENHGETHQSALYAIGLILFFIVIVINLLIIAISNMNKNKTKRLKNRKQKNLSLKHNAYYEPYKLTVLVQTYTDKKFFKTIHSAVLKFFMITSTMLIIGFTTWILTIVLFKGLAGFSFGTFTEIEGQRAGIFALLLTTLMLVLSTIIFAIPLALFAAVYLAEYAHKDSKFAKFIRFVINVLASTPSIVFGVFGLSLFIIAMGLPMSIFASSLTMTIVILPSMITSFEDSITSVPTLYKEAAYGMGMTKTGVLFKVIIPNSTKGLVTGIILAVARIIGESAPVYLTLGTPVRMPGQGFLSSGATLTTQIYMMASEGGSPNTMGIAYQIALVTVLLVLGLNWLSKYIGVRLDPTFKKVGFKLWWINQYNKIFKHDYKKSFNDFWIGTKKRTKKTLNYFNFKRLSIHIKNSKTRRKIIKTIKMEAKENGRKK